MGKKEQYEKAIKELGQCVCLDKGLNIAEQITLFDLMERSGAMGIRELSGNKTEEVKFLLQNG